MSESLPFVETLVAAIDTVDCEIASENIRAALHALIDHAVAKAREQNIPTFWQTDAKPVRELGRVVTAADGDNGGYVYLPTIVCGFDIAGGNHIVRVIGGNAARRWNALPRRRAKAGKGARRA